MDVERELTAVTFLRLDVTLVVNWRLGNIMEEGMNSLAFDRILERATDVQSFPQIAVYGQLQSETFIRLIYLLMGASHMKL